MNRKRSTGSLGVKLALAGFSIALTVALLELVVRVAVDPQRWRLRQASDDWVPDAELGWANQPNLDVRWHADGAFRQLQTNSDGLLPKSATRARGAPLRVLLIGDSTVIGRGVVEAARLHAALRQQLAARGVSADVINAGVDGYSTDQALLQMQRLIPRYRPDFVTYSLCDNDFGGNASREAYGMPKPRFVRQSGGQLALEPPPYRWLGQRRAGTRLQDVIQHVAVYRLLQPGIVTARAALAGWEERNLAGMNSDYYFRPEAAERLDWRLLGALLARMDETARAGNARFAAYAMPSLGAVWKPSIDATLREHGLRPDQYDRAALERRLVDAAAVHGVASLVMLPRFAQHRAEGPFHLLPRDPHNNGQGYRVIAEVLADWIAPAHGSKQ